MPPAIAHGSGVDELIAFLIPVALWLIVVGARKVFRRRDPDAPPERDAP